MVVYLVKNKTTTGLAPTKAGRIRSVEKAGASVHGERIARETLTGPDPWSTSRFKALLVDLGSVKTLIKDLYRTLFSFDRYKFFYYHGTVLH